MRCPASRFLDTLGPELVGFGTPNRFAEAPISVPGPPRNFKVDEWFVNPQAASCNAMPRADQPVWSPEGRTPAFYVEGESIGLSGASRLDNPYHLYLLGSGDVTPRRVIDRVLQPRALAWSPDGKSLALPAKHVAGRGPRSWLLDVQTFALQLAYGDVLSPAVWSPNGRQLGGIVERSGIFDTRVVLVALP